MENSNEIRCQRCNRKLRTWKSRQAGFGPSCERKYLEEIHKKQVKIEEI